MQFPFVLALIALLTFAPVNAVANDRVVPQSREHISLSFAPVVKKITPSVVNIYTKRVIRQAAHPFFADPFFAPFFGNDFGMAFGGSHMRERVISTLGSGVIVAKDGLIVTNAHVIDGASEIVVVLNDGREFEADISIIDKPSDLALLRMKNPPAQLQAVTMKTSDHLEVGDLVLAVGNPFGVGQTVTSGIVSAVARSSAALHDFNFFIQTDAAINPGNSGGPLVAMDGTVIGINTAIYSRSGGSNGIGFAVPAEMVQSVINAEKNGHKTSKSIIRGWLGFTAQPVTGEIAQSLGLEYPRGALVDTINAHSPAAQAGLKSGDLIIGLNNTPILSPQELKFRLGITPINGTVALEIMRKGKKETIEFRIIAAPEKPARDMRRLEGRNPFSGLKVVNLSPAVIEEMNLNTSVERGVVIESIPERSHAVRLGMQVGDVIKSVNDHVITDTAQLDTLLKNMRAQTGWKIHLDRNGTSRQIILR